MKALVAKFVDVRTDDELKGLLWGTAYGFLIMLSYYILRAVRDEISAADRGNPVRELSAEEGFVWAIAADGTPVLPLPVDHGRQLAHRLQVRASARALDRTLHPGQG